MKKTRLYSRIGGHVLALALMLAVGSAARAGSRPALVDSGTTDTTGVVLHVVSPVGQPDPPAGTHTLTSGTLVEALQGETAAGLPGERCRPSGWSGEGAVPTSGTAAAVTFTLDRESTLTWHWQPQHLLSVPALPADPVAGGTVAVLSASGGAVDTTQPEGIWADDGTSLTLRAVPAPGFSFSSWILPNGNTTTTAVIDLNLASSTTLTAVYNPLLMVRCEPTTPTGTAVPAINSVTTYTLGALVDASMTTDTFISGPNDRYVPVGWNIQGAAPSIDDGTASSCTMNRVVFRITEPTTLTWTWRRESVITVQAYPAKGGTVAPADPFWAAAGEVVDLQATAKGGVFPGYAFHHWNDDLNATSATYPLLVDGPTTMTANFYPLVAVFSLVSAPWSPSGNTSVVPYDQDTTFSVQSPYVDPASKSRWTCTGATVYNTESWTTSTYSGASFILKVTDPLIVFWQWSGTEFYLDASARPVGGGEVLRTSDGQPAAGYYPANTVLHLKYTTHPDFVFQHWGGDASGTQTSVTVVMDRSRKAFAYYRPVPHANVPGYRVDLLGQTGGASYTTCLDDRYAYIGEGPNLTVLDLSRPGEPLPTGKLVLPGIIQGITVKDGLVYVAAGYGGLCIVQLNSYGTPTLLGCCGLPGFATQVAVSGYSAFVAAGYGGGLQAINVGDPANPEVVFSDTAHGPGWGVAVQGEQVYLASNGVQVYEFYGGDPTTTNWRGGFGAGENTSAVRVEGARAYVACDSYGLRIWDVSNPLNALPLGGQKFGGATTDVTTSGSLACVATSNGVTLLNGSNPATTMTLAAYAHAGYRQKAALSGHLLGVSDGYTGLHLLDIANPSAPTLLASYGTKCVRTAASGYAIGMALQDGRLYYPDWDQGLAILDVQDSTYPFLAGRYRDPDGNAARAVALATGATTTTAFLADRNYGLRKIDVSDPAQPALQGAIQLPANCVTAAGTTGLVGSETGSVYVVDLAAMRVVSSKALPRATSVRGMMQEGNYYYTASWGAGVHVVNAGQPTSLTVAGPYASSGGAISIVHWNSLYYVADGAYGVTKIDPHNDYARTRYPLTRGSAYALAVTPDSRLLVAAGDGGLQVFDISDSSAAPRLLGYHDVPGGAYGVVTANYLAYVACGDGGLCILKSQDVNPTPTPTPEPMETPTPEPTPEPPPGPTVVSMVSRSGYATTLFQAGKALYTDHALTIANPISSKLSGQTFIQTRNGDGSTANSNNYLSFQIDRASTVYVALDSRNTPPPPWLAGWACVSDTFSVSDRTLGWVLYSKSFAAGMVTLGANRATGSPLDAQMYSVIVVPQTVPKNGVPDWGLYEP